MAPPTLTNKRIAELANRYGIPLSIERHEKRIIHKRPRFLMRQIQHYERRNNITDGLPKVFIMEDSRR